VRDKGRPKWTTGTDAWVVNGQTGSARLNQITPNHAHATVGTGADGRGTSTWASDACDHSPARTLANDSLATIRASCDGTATPVGSGTGGDCATIRTGVGLCSRGTGDNGETDSGCERQKEG
jgi:hypothetical protein